MNTLDSHATKPFFSVMIPTYNAPLKYLEVAVRSVLAQEAGPAEMEIQLIDDGSPNGPPTELVRRIAGDRIRIHCERNSGGLSKSLNRCIERARGRYVHILHQDDFVLPGFYRKVWELANRHHEVALIATRSFVVDSEGVISGVTGRLVDLENAGRDVKDFFYITPIQCPGVVVKRSFYEAHGGFRSDLRFTLDCEMWARAISSNGGVVAPDVLACYRQSDLNETARLKQTAEIVRDIDRLNRIFKEQFPEFDFKKATRRTCELAMNQYEALAQTGNAGASMESLEYWKRNATGSERIRHFVKNLIQLIESKTQRV